MKAEEMRDMSVEDLEAESMSLSEQLFKLRFQLATGQLENVRTVDTVRKNLARVKFEVRIVVLDNKVIHNNLEKEKALFLLICILFIQILI